MVYPSRDSRQVQMGMQIFGRLIGVIDTPRRQIFAILKPKMSAFSGRHWHIQA
jgi:hypothetical protein